MVAKVALLTAGGFAPCLSSAIGGLIERYTSLAPEVEIIAYRYGYQGLLQGDVLPVTPAVRERAAVLHRFGGSPIGNSRVKLTNAADLVDRGLVPAGVDPLQAAADRLTADGVDVLHTIGGDGTHTTGGGLTAAAARAYREWLDTRTWLPDIGLSREAWEVHGVYVPEAVFDLEVEAGRLKETMDRIGSVNLFISEGAGVETILAELERSGEEVPRDPFGNVKIDKINPGTWFASKFAERLDARKVMVQKSGYFSRSAA